MVEGLIPIPRVADSFEHVAEEQYNLPAEGLQSEDDDEPWEVVEA